MRCATEWQDYAGPTECPVCHHLYLKWVNYKEFGVHV